MVQWGYQLVSAAHGMAAREELESRKIDICIMDWEMPGMTGPEVSQWLHSGQVENIPYTILLTSKDRPEDIQAGYEAGADDYLVKPCDLKYLRRIVNCVAEKLRRRSIWMELDKAESDQETMSTPLDVCMAHLGLARRAM